MRSLSNSYLCDASALWLLQFPAPASASHESVHCAQHPGLWGSRGMTLPSASNDQCSFTLSAHNQVQKAPLILFIGGLQAFTHQKGMALNGKGTQSFKCSLIKGEVFQAFEEGFWSFLEIMMKEKRAKCVVASGRLGCTNSA